MNRWMYCLALSLPLTLTGGDIKIIELKQLQRNTLVYEGFELKKPVDVKVIATGLGSRSKDAMLTYAWILNGKTRDRVWEMTVDNSREGRQRYLRRAEQELQLSAGRYEVYYAVAPAGSVLDYKEFGDFLDDLFGGFRGDRWKRYVDEWGVELSVDEADESEVVRTPEVEGGEEEIQLISMGNDEFDNKVFSLKRRTRVGIYALGEGSDGEMFDYGWIINAGTRETVWEMDYSSTRHGGGAKKNRMVRDELTLEAGEYILYYVTDGSHSYEEWNQLPPYDPIFWGITVHVSEAELEENVLMLSAGRENGHLILDLTRVGNDRLEKAGFRLEDSAKVRILCFGEFGYSKRFVDYGWIINAGTHETVWEMNRRNTRHGGGAEKNRVFDGVIPLGPGTYEVLYRTDDSHAYGDWNAGPPYDPNSWGITVWLANGAGSGLVSSYSSEEDPLVLVQMIRIGDDERVRKRFHLGHASRIRIYALGEGDEDEMNDFGWIENERGREVWIMEYEDTRHAGGAEKNRVYNGVVELEQGDYTVYYESDDSHSFDDWNSDPPGDPDGWGITLRIEEQ